jgi:hypothetical protein
MTSAAPRDLVLVDDAENRRQRRARLADTDRRYGLDFVEVVTVAPTLWTLRLVFVPDTSGSSAGHGFPPGLRPEQLCICRLEDPDGTMLPEIRAVSFAAGAAGADANVVTVTVTLHRPVPLFVARAELTVSLEQVLDVDPIFSAAPFYLNSARGPAADPIPDPATLSVPVATYAAKEYASFVALMMDRLRLTLPGWEERSPADLGVMLVELLAYAGDYLSYAQDAAATEAYLATARRRQSLRRHARLLDYDVDEGCSARVWLQCELHDPAASRVPAGTAFSTASATPVVFESLHDAELFADHNRMALYGWGIDPFVILAGATEVVLLGHHPHLAAGDVVMLVSYGDPRVGANAAAPPEAHPVRLVEDAAIDHDPVQGQDITRIAWSADDALPFSLFAGSSSPPWSSVRGNVMLAEHHTTRSTTEVTPGAAPGVFVVQIYDTATVSSLDVVRVASAAPYDHAVASAQPAALATAQDQTLVRPCVSVLETRANHQVAWTPRRSFLTSSRFARDVVVDVDEGGLIQLRFGDGNQGRPLAADAKLTVELGVGGGPSGNIGARLAWRDDGRMTITNWLPAVGGTEAETAAQIRTNAPLAFQEQERCVTAADYAAMAARVPGVRAAAARIGWTGSFAVAVVYVLPEARDALDGALRERVRAYVFARRLAGVAVEVRPARGVGVRVALRVGVQRGYDARAVWSTVERELGTGNLADGRKGLFHRDAFGLGQPVYLASILARAAAVAGVASVAGDRLAREGDEGDAPRGPPPSAIGVEDVEVARLAELVIEGDE